MKIIIAKAIHQANYPIHILVERFHVEEVAVIIKSKKTAKITVGIVLMLVGSTMATHPVVFIPHVIWDAMSYGLHGYGALPLIKVACKHLNLEELEERAEKELVNK